MSQRFSQRGEGVTVDLRVVDKKDERKMDGWTENEPMRAMYHVL